MLHKNSLSYSLSGRKWSGQNLTMNLIYDLPIYQSLTTDYNMQEVLLQTKKVSKLPGYSYIITFSNLFTFYSLGCISSYTLLV